jgi:glucose-6-phosphate isomerase
MPDRWDRFCRQWFHDSDLGFSLDVSRVVGFDRTCVDQVDAVARSLTAMAALEAGARANCDEDRQVGHYWLRDPDLAPAEDQAGMVRRSVDQVVTFAQEILSGKIAPPSGGKFRHVLHVGIGGSALGPQLAADALPGGNDACTLHFMDNTDPDGMGRILAGMAPHLATTLVVIVSKSGGTRETRNGMLATAGAFHAAGLEFGKHAVAITGPGSRLDALAEQENWLLRLPMADWVGGRTSQTSAVGLLPMALAGRDVRAFLAGARAMDALTRQSLAQGNPALLLALSWHAMAAAEPRRAMVVLPYKDRLSLMARYLQQLVMESLGKETDLDGATVHQGLTVYGNKGTTDQHAFVQQLRDGPDDFFATFIQVLTDTDPSLPALQGEDAAGDDLLGFLLGTREALSQKGRSSILISMRSLDERSLGALIALFERAVGLYAFLVNLNAYHQPGVEAGKKAAEAALELQVRAMDVLAARAGDWLTAGEVAEAAGSPADVETVFHLLVHLATNPGRNCRQQESTSPATWRFSADTKEP